MKENKNQTNDLGKLLLEGPTEPEAEREIAANLIELERCYLEIAEHKKQLAETTKQLWDLKQHKIRHDLIILFETIANKCERLGALKEKVEIARSEVADLRERVKALEQLVQKLEQYRQNQILYE